MQCPKCAHRIPDKADRCMYCGARTKDETPSETKTESPVLLLSSREMGESLTGIRGTKEEINFKKLEELPPSLRAKVEEILKKGEGQSEEIGTSFPNFPELIERTDGKRKRMGFVEALKFLLKKE